MGGFLAFAALHAQDVGLGGGSIPLLVYGAVVVICRVAFARVPDRLPTIPLGAAALGTMAIGMVVLALAPAPAGVLSGTVIIAVGVAFTTPAFFAATFSRTAATERGAASGTLSAALDLGIGVGPILLGFVVQAHGMGWAFACAAGVAAVGAAWTLRLRPSRTASR